MSSVRVVRPRPLGLDERIPVYWSGEEAPLQIRAVDGGALWRYLQEAETQERSRKRQRGPKYKAPKEGVGSKRSDLERAHLKVIHIPGVRPVADYACNEAALAVRGPSIRGDVAAAPYVRYQEVLPGVYDEHQVAEYDMSSEDEAFLRKLNGQPENGRGFMAAAVGFYNQLSSRFRTSSGDVGAALSGSGGGATDEPQPKTGLTVDEFEHAIDKLELTHFEAVVAWWERTNEGPSTSAARVPKIPGMKALLPKSKALDLFPDLDKKLASSLYDHWAKRRSALSGPLLPRLWFEQPWKAVAFAHLADESDEDNDEHLPFMGGEPRSAKGGRGAARRRMNDEDAVEAMRILRNELEVVRTLADQVRRREKLKRTMATMWQSEWRLRLRAGLPPPPPPPEMKRQKGAQGGGPAPAAACAATGGAGPTRPAAAVVQGRPTSATAEARAALAAAAAIAASAAAAGVALGGGDTPPGRGAGSRRPTAVLDPAGLTPWGARRKRVGSRTGSANASPVAAARPRRPPLNAAVQRGVRNGRAPAAAGRRAARKLPVWEPAGQEEDEQEEAAASEAEAEGHSSGGEEGSRYTDESEEEADSEAGSSELEHEEEEEAEVAQEQQQQQQSRRGARAGGGPALHLPPPAAGTAGSKRRAAKQPASTQRQPQKQQQQPRPKQAARPAKQPPQQQQPQPKNGTQPVQQQPKNGPALHRATLARELAALVAGRQAKAATAGARPAQQQQQQQAVAAAAQRSSRPAAGSSAGRRTGGGAGRAAKHLVAAARQRQAKPAPVPRSRVGVRELSDLGLGELVGPLALKAAPAQQAAALKAQAGAKRPASATAGKLASSSRPRVSKELAQLLGSGTVVVGSKRSRAD